MVAAGGAAAAYGMNVPEEERTNGTSWIEGAGFASAILGFYTTMGGDQEFQWGSGAERTRPAPTAESMDAIPCPFGVELAFTADYVPDFKRNVPGFEGSFLEGGSLGMCWQLGQSQFGLDTAWSFSSHDSASLPGGATSIGKDEVHLGLRRVLTTDRKARRIGSVACGIGISRVEAYLADDLDTTLGSDSTFGAYVTLGAYRGWAWTADYGLGFGLELRYTVAGDVVVGGIGLDTSSVEARVTLGVTTRAF
jgi:hypothetical protein